MIKKSIYFSNCSVLVLRRHSDLGGGSEEAEFVVEGEVVVELSHSEFPPGKPMVRSAKAPVRLGTRHPR